MKKQHIQPIVEYLQQRGSFAYPDEILEALVPLIGKSRGVMRLYVHSMLLRYRKRGILIRIKPASSPIYAWGLSAWGKGNASGENDYMPGIAPAEDATLPASVLRKRTKGSSFVQDPSFK